jgi:hypothetical protein
MTAARLLSQSYRSWPGEPRYFPAVTRFIQQEPNQAFSLDGFSVDGLCLAVLCDERPALSPMREPDDFLAQ